MVRTGTSVFDWAITEFATAWLVDEPIHAAFNPTQPALAASAKAVARATQGESLKKVASKVRDFAMAFSFPY